VFGSEVEGFTDNYLEIQSATLIHGNWMEHFLKMLQMQCTTKKALIIKEVR